MTDYEVGDWVTPTLGVSPADGTTAATLTIYLPDGTTASPTPTTADTGATWTAAAYELTQPGVWVESWRTTGTGAGRQNRVLLVAPAYADVPTGRVYATTADYARWLHAAPPLGSGRALAVASADVDRMLLTAVYTVDDDGYPTDTDERAAVRWATCAQAEYNRGRGDRYAVGAGRITQASIGSVSVTRTGSDGAAAPGWCSPRAWQILTAAGLTGHSPLAW